MTRSLTLAAVALLGASSAFLGACASRPAEKVVYREVLVPVPVACVPAETPEEPELMTPAQVAALPSDPASLRLLGADWLQQYARRKTTEVVVSGCRRAGSQPQQ